MALLARQFPKHFQQLVGPFRAILPRMRTFFHRLLSLVRTRGFDAASGGRRWEGARTVDGDNVQGLSHI